MTERLSTSQPTTTCQHWRIGFDRYPTDNDDMTWFCLDCKATLDHDCESDQGGTDTELRCSDCGKLRWVRPQ